MSLSVLTIAQRALSGPGMTQPSSIVTAGDDIGAQLQALLYTTVDDMVRRTDWQEQVTEAIITTLAQEDQGALPTLFPDYRRILAKTVWNRTAAVPLRQVNAQEWQTLKSGLITYPISRLWRIRGNHFMIYGNTTLGDTVSFEYSSRNWLTNYAGASPSDTIVADSDLCVLPYEPVLYGLRWRWQEAKGLDYSEAFRMYETVIESVRGSNAGEDAASLNAPTNMDTVFYPFDVSVAVGS